MLANQEAEGLRAWVHRDLFKSAKVSEDLEKFELEAAEAFHRKILILNQRGQKLLDEKFLRRLEASVNCRDSSEWTGIVAHCTGYRLHLNICRVSAQCSVKILHELQIVRDIHQRSIKNGFILFDFIAQEVTRFAKKHEDRFDSQELVPFGLIFPHELDHKNFNQCILLDSTKRSNMEDLKVYELNKLMRERIEYHGTILGDTIVNDNTCISAGFYSYFAGTVARTIIVSSGINLAHILSADDECLNRSASIRSFVDTESGKIGDSAAFYRTVLKYLDPADLNFLDSIGNEIRVAEKLSCETFMLENFVHNLQLKFSYFVLDGYDIMLDRMKEISFEKLNEFYSCNSPEESDDPLLKRLPQELFTETKKEFFRIVRRSASVVAAIVFVSIEEDDHFTSETVTIGIHGSIIENIKEYREFIRESLLRMISKLRPNSRIKDIEYKFFEDSPIFGMARICKILKEIGLSDSKTK